MSIFFAILIFLAILGVLIFVHELGHFLTARRNGITCHEFGFGFPPRLVGVVRDEHTGEWRVVWGGKPYNGRKTLYSLNWLPIGGFVRIKGEDGRDKDPDSFAPQSAWVRFKVLVAGVVMNFIFFYVFVSLSLFFGTPDDRKLSDNGKVVSHSVLVQEIQSKSPAAVMGFKQTDAITEICTGIEHACVSVTSTEQFIAAVEKNKGKQITVRVLRSDGVVDLVGAPRMTFTPDQGALGLGVGEIFVVRYPFFESFWWGVGTSWDLLKIFGSGIAQLFATIFSDEKGEADLAGPVGILFYTRDFAALGLGFLMRFAAILSLNLAIINILPIPALDGGRILFLLIEKLKGSPVSRKAEGIAHSIGFISLIFLMVWVTVKDFDRFNVIDKMKGLF